MKTDNIMRVGIIGPGWIAEKAARTLRETENCEAYAIGSRSMERAKEFADRWGIPKAYGSYSELIADPDVDLVYVGTPHSHHYGVTREAGHFSINCFPKIGSGLLPSPSSAAIAFCRCLPHTQSENHQWPQRGGME